jgi:hypothetical protein
VPSHRSLQQHDESEEIDNDRASDDCSTWGQARFLETSLCAGNAPSVHGGTARVLAFACSGAAPQAFGVDDTPCRMAHTTVVGAGPRLSRFERDLVSDMHRVRTPDADQKREQRDKAAVAPVKALRKATKLADKPYDARRQLQYGLPA